VAAAAEDGYGSAPLALREVLLLVAFSYLIGNGDLHAKNFSAAARTDGTREASPVYDLVSTQPYPGWRDPMALDLYGRANRLDRRHLVDSGGRLGLPARAVNRLLDQLVERAAPWVDRVGEIGMQERTTQLLADLLRRRIADVGG
jgi:serine/threonine-protein kinase HipA